MRKTQVRVSTYSKYAAVLEKHIKPHLGRYLPQDITTAAVDAFSQELLASLSPKTVHDILVTLHGILKYTAGCVVQALPHVEIHYPKEEKREMRVLTREEQARFVAYLSADITPCKFGLLLALFTGMRIGELCALKWENICVAERTVRVAATLQRLQENGADRRPLSADAGSAVGICPHGQRCLYGAACAAISHRKICPRLRAAGRPLPHAAALVCHPRGGGRV